MSKIDIETGDVVCMKTSRLPSVEKFRAAVEFVKEDEFGVFSVELADFGLTPEDLTFKTNVDDYTIISRIPAAQAVPEETNGLTPGQRIKTLEPNEKGEILTGNLIAAIDGLAYCKTDDGEDFSVGVLFIEKVI